MTQSKGFVKFIAYLQIIGIILVVLGHSFHEYPDGDAHGTSLLIYRLCYNFRMPLFLFVSGFLMIYTTFGRDKLAPSIKRFTIKKIERLLIPFAVLTLLTYVPRAYMSSIADDPIPLSTRDFVESLYITDKLPIPFFWFIQAIFLLLIVSYTYISVCKRWNIHPAIIFASIIAFFIIMQYVDWGKTEIFGHHSALYLGIYFILGATYCEFYTIINKYLPLDSCISFAISLIIWLTLFLTGEHTLIARFASVFGIMMCISIAKLMVKHNVTILDHLIGANYIIFLLSWYFNVLTQQVLSHFIDLPWYVHTVMSLTFGIYIPWLFYIYMSRNQEKKWVKTAGFLLGQSFKKDRER